MYQCRLVRCAAPCPGVEGAACARRELTLPPPRSTCPTSSSSRRRSASTACTSSGAAACPLRHPTRPAAPRSACSEPLARHERARAGAPARRARAAAGPARVPGRGWCRCSACRTRSWCTRRAWTRSSSTAPAPSASSSSCPSRSWRRPCVRAPPLSALPPHGPPRMHAPAQLTVVSSVRPRAGAGAAVIPLYATGGRGTLGVTTSLSQLTMAHLPPGSALYWCAPGRRARCGRCRNTEVPNAPRAQGAGRAAKPLRASRAASDGWATCSSAARVREHTRGSDRARRTAPG